MELLCPCSTALKKNIFHQTKSHFVWWNPRISHGKLNRSLATEMVVFHELLIQWNSIFLNNLCELYISWQFLYYEVIILGGFTLKNQRKSINNSHIFYHNLILKSYPKHYQLILLFGFVTIIIDKVEILEWLILVWFLALP